MKEGADSLRGLGHLIFASREEHFTLVEHHVAVADRSHAVDVVANNDRRVRPVTRLHLPDELEDLGRGHRIEPRRRIIVECDAGLRDHRADEPHPLLHATGELARHLIECRAQSNDTQLRLHATIHLCRRARPLLHERKAHIVPHGHEVKERVVLKESEEEIPYQTSYDDNALLVEHQPGGVHRLDRGIAERDHAARSVPGVVGPGELLQVPRDAVRLAQLGGLDGLGGLAYRNGHDMPFFISRPIQRAIGFEFN